jgi:tRNA (guanine-N7-)-methyltransferase
MNLDKVSIPSQRKPRQIMLKDSIFYAPMSLEEGQDFIFPGWSDPALFGNTHPLHLEYCSGNGAWIAEKAMNHPDINWIAVEKKLGRAKKIAAKANKLKPKNLIVIYGEAFVASSLYFLEESCQAAYINFPDPWPKRRHAKNRLIQPKFLDQVYRLLKKDALFTLVTDDPVYSEQMLKEMGRHPGFTSFLPLPYYITECPGYGSSYFDQLWREKGKGIRYHQFIKMG